MGVLLGFQAAGGRGRWGRSVFRQRHDDFLAAGTEETDVGAALGIVPVIGVLILDVEALARTGFGLDEAVEMRKKGLTPIDAKSPQ